MSCGINRSNASIAGQSTQNPKPFQHSVEVAQNDTSHFSKQLKSEEGLQLAMHR